MLPAGHLDLRKDYVGSATTWVSMAPHPANFKLHWAGEMWADERRMRILIKGLPFMGGAGRHEGH